MADDILSTRPDSRLRFDQRILLLALVAGLPAALVALILLWTGPYTSKVQWTLTVFIVGVWTGCSFSVRHRVVLPLQTLSNLLAALRESDFSIRARGASGDDPLGAVMLEVNVLAATLHDQRLGALEASALLRTVMVEIDVAVFTFDGAQTLGENIADVAGLAAAYDGWLLSLGGKTPPSQQGYTGQQVFFLGYAQTRQGNSVYGNWGPTMKTTHMQKQRSYSHFRLCCYCCCCCCCISGYSD